jgi:hypothetical protein
LKELPESGIIYLTQLFNAILRTGFFLPQWKIAQIIMIPKPNKDLSDIESYRPMTLLPIISKLFVAKCYLVTSMIMNDPVWPSVTRNGQA